MLGTFKLKIESHHLMQRLDPAILLLLVDGDVEDVAGDVDGLFQRLRLGKLGRMIVETLLHFRRPSLHQLVDVRHRIGVVHFSRWLLPGNRDA